MVLARAFGNDDIMDLLTQMLAPKAIVFVLLSIKQHRKLTKM